MKWTPEAEAAIKKVPFFVRKRVRARVEKEAAAAGKRAVSLAQVRSTQARFLSGMAADIKGYQIDTCFGPGGCPNRVFFDDSLVESIENLLAGKDLLGFLKQSVSGELKYHHEFRVALADCPNACSQPQIKDIGIIGACCPEVTENVCELCEACLEVCKENAILLDHRNRIPKIDLQRCLRCGMCVKACPSETLIAGHRGFRVLIAGKLGRHPRLAMELPGIFNQERVLAILEDCIDFYKQHSKSGRRFAAIFTDADFENLVKRYQ